MRPARAQIVRTRLVADLETPVSAMLKLSAGRAQLLPARIGRGRRRPRPLLDHRHRARPIFRAVGAKAEINRRRPASRDPYEPMAEPPLDALRA